MQLLSTFFVLFLAATTVLSAPKTDAAATIKTFGLNGSGCPPGSTTATLSNDKSTVSATFSQFIPSVSTQSFRKNCQASISVDVPAGKKFAVDKVGYSGFVQLDPKVAVVHGTTVYFQAQLEQQSASDTLKGPVTKTVDLSNKFSGTVWSKCGAGTAIVNVDISLYLNADGSSDGFASVDDAKFGPFVLADC
ncbi:hypothetical protein PM082_004716 [Marasmius tenuissimus]|nr:hypothetical protein PM082_004716 [Marasmius tenuissimus]